MLSKAQIKYIQSLQHKKYRQKFSQFIAEGDKIVQELLRFRLDSVVAVYATGIWLEQHKPLLPGDNTQLELVTVEEGILKQISSLSTPNHAIALVKMFPAPGKIELKGKVTIALENLQDPGNMGTIIRIADWFGVSQVICSKDTVDPYNAKSIQATMGSFARIPVYETDLQSLFEAPKDVPVYAATLHGKDITTFPPIKEGVILIGNESRGLSEAIVKASSHEITIPRIGHAESLNAAIATGIICGRLLL